MRRLFSSILLCLLLLVGSPAVVPCDAQVPEVIAGASLISQLVSGLKSVVKQIEDSGHSLIDHGNIALGQQQVLMASTLAETIRQFESAYGKSLTLTFDKVDVQTQNAYKALNRMVKDADRIRSSTVADAQNLIYQTQGAANQLLGTLPFVTRTPVYYGFTTRDILLAANAAPSDIEILGFYLTDRDLKFRKPKITVADTVIPDDKVDAQFDRVKVQLPDQLRNRLRLANTPCEPIKTFPVKIQVFYTKHPVLSKASSYFDSDVTFNGQASPGKPLYEITAEFTGTSTTTTQTPQSFSVSSSSINVGCESTQPAGLQWTAPAGASQLNPTAGWVNTDNLKSQPASAAATGLTATASGSITGLDKQCVFGVCNCPGGGHGTLNLTGTYVIPVTSTAPYNSASTVTAASDGSIVVPSADGLKLTSITIRFKRKGCGQVLDEATFTVPDDPNRNVQQTSRNGYFTVNYDRGNVTFAGTALLASL